jgi:hypothetical protein
MDRIDTLETLVIELREQLVELQQAEKALTCILEIMRVEDLLTYA